MSAETSGIPLVVRYNNRGQPDGLKEELNIIVNSVSANEYKGGNISATGIPHVSSIEDVSITGTIQTGHVIAWDTTGWVNVPQTGGPGSTTFTGLDDTPDIYPDPGDDPPDPILRYTPDGLEGGPGIIYSQYGEGDLVNFNSIYNNYKPGGASSNEVTSIRSDLTSFDLINYKLGTKEFVNPSTPGTNYIIQYDGTKWVFADPGTIGGGGSTTFQGLNDVDIDAYIADRFIIVKSTPAATGVEMSEFTATQIVQVSSDVYTVSSDLDALETTVTNLTLSGNLSDVSVTGPITQNPSYLKWDSGSSKWIPAGLDLSQSDVVDLTDVDSNLTTSNEDKILAIKNSSISATQYDLTDLSRSKQIYTEITAAPADSFLTTGSDPNILGSVPKSDFVTTAINSNLSSYASDLSSYISNNETAWSTDTNTTNHSELTNRDAADAHTQYVLSATNQELSGLVTNIETSTVSLSGYIAANQSIWSTDTNTNTLLDLTDTDINNPPPGGNFLAYQGGKWRDVNFFGSTLQDLGGEIRAQVNFSGLSSSGSTQGDLLAVGPSGTVISQSSLLPSINPAPLFEDIGKLIIINEAANDLVESSAMKWDYTSQGLEVLGDVSAQNYYGNFSGATAELYNISGVSSIQFATDMPSEYTAVLGEVYFDTDAQTLSIQTGEETTLQVGQEQVIHVRNTGAEIANGSVVYVSGVQGTGAAKLLIGKASAAISEDVQNILGIATQTIPNNTDGFVTVFGVVNDVNTAAYPVGTRLYLSTSAGLYTSAQPEAPNHSVSLGIVLRQHANTGKIFVKVDPGYDIADLHDVLLNGIQPGDVLRWNGSLFAPSAFDHGTLDGLADNDHPQYVLSATNQALSSLTTSIQASTVDLSAYIAANETAWSTDTDTTDHGALSGRSDDDHTQYVIKSPTTGARNTIQPASDVAGLTIQAGLSNTDNLFVIKDSLTADVLTIDLNGDITTDGDIISAGSVKGNTVSAVSIDVSDLSATYSNLALDVIYDHLLPHDQNGNWNGVSNGAGSAYQQNQGSNTWMQAADVQGVMTVSNGNGTASTDAAAKVHVNFSSYLSVGAIHYFRVSTNRATDIKWRFGLVNESLAATAAPSNGVYFEYDSTQGSNLSGVTADGSSRTFSDTGVSVASTMSQGWRWFGIKIISGDGGPAVQFFDVDNDPTVAIAEITTTLPASGTNSAMRAFVQCVGNGATYGSLYLDTYGIQIQNGWIPRKIT